MQPHENREAELGVLACALVDPDLVTKLVDNLTSFDFYHEDLRSVFNGFKQLCLNLKPVDEITLGNYLKNAELIEVLKGGVTTLPSKAHFPEYIQIVREKSLLRQIVNDARAIAMTTKDGILQPEEIFLKARQLTETLHKNVTETGSVSVRVAGDLLIKELEQYISDNKTPLLLKTGWPSLDAVIGGGLGPGRLACIAARPCIGKTAAALNLAAYQCRQETAVGFFSLEMTTHDLLTRVYSSEANIPQERFSQVLSQSDLEAIKITQKYVSSWKFFLDDSPQTVESLYLNIVKMVKTHGCKLIIVDYLQLIGNNNHREDTLQTLCRACKMLMDTAKDLNIAVLALSQLNRTSEQDGKEPGLHNLKGCGNIEQDCWGVILLHRTKDPCGPGRYRTTFRIGKWRSGQTGAVVPLVLTGYLTKFTEQ